MALSPAKRLAVVVASAGVLAAAGLTVAITTASAESCPKVEVVFARGTGEPKGLGSVGTPFVTALRNALSGYQVTAYPVNYAASFTQTSAGPGSADLTNHVKTVAAQCPSTSFVLGGYSQGATVVDLAIGLRAGLTAGTAIPTELAPRIKAVVVFGNPLRLTGRDIPTASQLYGGKALDLCNPGDPVCGAGSNLIAHLTYRTNGATSQGGQFAAQRVRAD